MMPTRYMDSLKKESELQSMYGHPPPPILPHTLTVQQDSNLPFTFEEKHKT